MNITAATLKAMQNTPAKEFGNIARMQYKETKPRVEERKNMSETHVYYQVQLVDRENLGLRMHRDTITQVVYFEENEAKKAINLWKKRVANDIIYHKVTFLDKAPYVDDTLVFGKRICVRGKDGKYYDCVGFDKGDVHIIMPLSSRVNPALVNGEEYINGI